MFESISHLILLAGLTGAVSGFLAGLFGIGGGIVVVPALYLLFQLLGAGPHTATTMAVATSLTCIIPTALSSVRSHYQLGNLNFRQLLHWFPAILLGSLSGAAALTVVNGWWIRLIFTVLILFVALNLLRKILFTTQQRQAFSEANDWSWYRRLLAYPLSFGIGALSAMAGVGGGALAAPLLVAWGYSAHRAVGTAAGFGLIISVPAVVMVLFSGNIPADAPQWSYSLINIPAFVAIASCSVVTAPLGVKFGKRVPHGRMLLLLALLLLIVATKMIFSLVG